MEKVLVSIFEEYYATFMNRIHKGFGQVSRDTWN